MAVRDRRPAPDDSGRPAQSPGTAASGPLSPIEAASLPETPAVADRIYPAPALTLREIAKPVRQALGSFDVEYDRSR